jgi:ubiquitin C
MRIHVKTPDGTILTLHVTPGDRVGDVKELVQNQTGIPIEEQCLLYGEKELNNDPTLSEYYIEHNSTIYLEGMKINIALPDGSTISFDVKPRDTVSDIKKGVKYATGISVEEHWLLFDGKEIDDNPTLSDYRIKHGSTLQLEPMKISIHTLDGKTIQFDVKPTDTIRAVKQRENEKEGQRLLFNGTELEDGPTLADYGIKHASTLDLEPTKINVQTLDGRIIPVIVKPSDTMGEIKKR